MDRRFFRNTAAADREYRERHKCLFYKFREMRISDLYEDGKTLFSCEVFPPRPETDLEGIFSTINRLEQLSPGFISVTYGAGGGTKKRTLEISGRISQDPETEALMHLTSVNSTRDDIMSILDKAEHYGIENILALRGDIPEGSGTEDKNPFKDFSYAADLIDFIRGRTAFCIGVAAYPEKHPEARSLSEDLDFLAAKIEAGGEFILTQLFFDNGAFFNFMDMIAAKGISVPVSAGIMPVTRAVQIRKITALCGAAISPGISLLIDRYGDSDEDMAKAGIDYASGQIEELISNGVSGIHLYTMNRAETALKIAGNTGLGISENKGYGSGTDTAL
jgi:methylenetetrahydrofolate reductase (NADPH)